ncbi:MAG: methionyl-tRNA formyltransferase, partial [Fusobacteria bacterium]|nr:methionyl-tRNA formyltransferase [Fusobacteriota bacterium]
RTASYTPQDSSQATFCGYIEKEHQHINFMHSTKKIQNIVRTFSPAPGAFVFLNGKRVKIFSVQECCESSHLEGVPGTVTGIAPKLGYIVKTGSSSVILTTLQPENKKIISGIDSLNGNLFFIGEHFS